MGSPKTVTYVSMKMALLDTKTFKIVETASKLEFNYTELMPRDKIHKLPREDFFILKDAYQPLFENAINALIEIL